MNVFEWIFGPSKQQRYRMEWCGECRDRRSCDICGPSAGRLTMRYEALLHPDGHSWRVRLHGEDPVKRPDGSNGLFCIMGVTEDQARGIAKLLNKMDQP